MVPKLFMIPSPIHFPNGGGWNKWFYGMNKYNKSYRQTLNVSTIPWSYELTLWWTCPPCISDLIQKHVHISNLRKQCDGLTSITKHFHKIQWWPTWPEDFKTPPTCSNWLSFDWDIWDQRQMMWFSEQWASRGVGCPNISSSH